MFRGGGGVAMQCSLGLLGTSSLPMAVLGFWCGSSESLPRFLQKDLCQSFMKMVAASQVTMLDPGRETRFKRHT